MAAALEDKMTLTFRNEMNEMKNMMKALVPTPVPIFKGVLMDFPPYAPSYVNRVHETGTETEVTKDKVQPESSQSTANVQPRVDHGKGKDKLKDNEKGMNEKEKDDEVRESVFEEILIDKEEFFLPKSPPIKPNKPTKTLPYPSRVEYEKKGKNDKVQIQKFWEMFKKIHVNITLADALILMPKYQKMLKSLLSNKEKLNEMANTPIDSISSPKEKDEDPNAIFTSSEVVKCDFLTTNVHDNKEEEIAFLDGLLEDENFFEMNDKKVESFERKTKEDFETKVEPEKKKELQVFHPDIEILNHFETTSYVGSDYVFYEDFSLVDMIFPVNIQGKVFDPGISHFEKDAFKDKSSKELAPSKALLTLDVFDPLHPPLMDFHVTKAFSGFTFSLLKIFSKKFVEPGIKNATVYLSSLVWGGFPDFGSFMVQKLWKDKAIPTISIDGLQSSLHKWEILSLFFIELTSILLA
ncbi:hypothetical protein Tco_0884263 [Tanacetum coccineum]